MLPEIKCLKKNLPNNLFPFWGASKGTTLPSEFCLTEKDWQAQACAANKRTLATDWPLWPRMVWSLGLLQFGLTEPFLYPQVCAEGYVCLRPARQGLLGVSERLLLGFLSAFSSCLTKLKPARPMVSLTNRLPRKRHQRRKRRKVGASVSCQAVK